jgi:hypothetical protein
MRGTRLPGAFEIPGKNAASGAQVNIELSFFFNKVVSLSAAITAALERLRGFADFCPNGLCSNDF